MQGRGIILIHLGSRDVKWAFRNAICSIKWKSNSLRFRGSRVLHFPLSLDQFRATVGLYYVYTTRLATLIQDKTGPMKTRVVFPGALDLLEHRAREGTCASSHATTGRCTRIGVTRGRLRQFCFVLFLLLQCLMDPPTPLNSWTSVSVWFSFDLL